MYSFVHTAIALCRLFIYLTIVSVQLCVWFTTSVLVPSLRALWQWMLALASGAADLPPLDSRKGDEELYRSQPTPPAGAADLPPVYGPPPMAMPPVGDGHLDKRTSDALRTVHSAFEDYGGRRLTIPDPDSALGARFGREPRVPLWVEILRRDGYRVEWVEVSSLNCPAWVVTKGDWGPPS